MHFYYKLAPFLPCPKPCNGFPSNSGITLQGYDLLSSPPSSCCLLCPRFTEFLATLVVSHNLHGLTLIATPPGALFLGHLHSIPVFLKITVQRPPPPGPSLTRICERAASDSYCDLFHSFLLVSLHLPFWHFMGICFLSPLLYH